MSKRNWTESQRWAISARNGSLLVSAAAGSGKTAVLVQRVIERLTDPERPCDADRLLIVTFTNAAAAACNVRAAASTASWVAFSLAATVFAVSNASATNFQDFAV